MKEKTPEEIMESIVSKSKSQTFRDRSYVMLQVFGVKPIIRRGFMGVDRKGAKVYRTVTYGKQKERYTLIGYDIKTDRYTSKPYANYQKALIAFKNKVETFTKKKGKGKKDY